MNAPNAVVTKKSSPLAQAQSLLDKLKPQMALALPKHLNVDRMSRLALTAFSTNPELLNCTPQSLAGSIMLASQLGIEIGVGGQGYLIPYKGTATFVPGSSGHSFTWRFLRSDGRGPPARPPRLPARWQYTYARRPLHGPPPRPGVRCRAPLRVSRAAAG